MTDSKVSSETGERSIIRVRHFVKTRYMAKANIPWNPRPIIYTLSEDHYDRPILSTYNIPYDVNEFRRRKAHGSKTKSYLEGRGWRPSGYRFETSVEIAIWLAEAKCGNIATTVAISHTKQREDDQCHQDTRDPTTCIAVVGNGSPFAPPPALRKRGDGLAMFDWPVAGMIAIAFVKNVLGLGVNGLDESAFHKFCTVVGWIPRGNI